MEAINISECVFADDLVIFARNERDLQHNLLAWKEPLKIRNMYINIEKIELMVIGKDESLNLQIEGIELEQVNSFRYLGIQIQSNREHETEINERISAAVKVYYSLNKKFLGRKVSNQTKLKVYRMIYCPILTNGCERWVLTKSLKSKLQAVEMKYLFKVKAVTRRDKIRNETIREELNVELII